MVPVQTFKEPWEQKPTKARSGEKHMGSDESKKHYFLGNLCWFIYNFGLFLLSKLVYWNKISQCKCLKVLTLTPIWRYKSCSTKHLAFAGTRVFRSFTVIFLCIQNIDKNKIKKNRLRRLLLDPICYMGRVSVSVCVFVCVFLFPVIPVRY